MTEPVPTPVERYLQAQRAGDATALADCFTEAGGVNDEGRTHLGREAIAAWHAGASSAFQYTSEITGADVLGEQAFRLTVHLEGDFPGGTADLEQLYALDGDRIAFLFITLAH